MRNKIRNIQHSISRKNILSLAPWGEGARRAGEGLLGVGLLFFLFSCSSEENLDHADLAAETAKVYYEQLLHGDVAAFVDGTAMHVDVVPTYREQLETSMKMFLGQQEKEHKGIKSVKKVKGTLTCPTDDQGQPKDTAHITANAFLIFNYGDNTSEQVVVPMVRVNGTWMMR